MRHRIMDKLIVGGVVLASLMAAGIVGANRTVITGSSQNEVSSSVSGSLDLVVTDAHTNSISLFPGKGNGDFGPRLDADAGLAPNGVVAGDFNKDGNLDLAVADTNGSTVAILLGDGLGHFSAPVLYPVGGNPSGIVTGDFNKDGNLDLAVANQNSSSVSVLYGNGDGTFGGRHDYLVGTGPTGIVSADFDKDGFLDLAVTDSYEATVGVLLANGTNGFGSCLFYPCGADHTSDPEGLVAGDFNNDTVMDLAVAIYNINSVGILLGDGMGGFSNQNIYYLGPNAAPYAITAGDFNEDKNLDVAVTDPILNKVYVLLGDGAGNISTRHDFQVKPSPVGILAARFTADENLDLAVANHDSTCVTILLGKGTGMFDYAENLTAGRGPTGLVAGKFRSDTTPPVVQITKPVNGVYIMNMRVLPFFRPLIFGRIDIQVSASDNNSGMKRVEFYIDSKLMNTSTVEPFHWMWSTFSLMKKHTITVLAFDNADNSAQAKIVVRKIF